MSYQIQNTLPTSQEIKEKFPLSDHLREQVLIDRKEIQAILRGEDSRKLLIVGPCSAWSEEAVLTYAQKLKKLSDEVSDRFKIILRSYLQKSRTANSWLGPLHQIDPSGSVDVEEGIVRGRKLFLQLLEIGLPVSDELVFLDFYPYFDDLLAWAAIGARSSEDPEHRIFASSVDIPIGIKNPTSGYTVSAVNAVCVAQSEQESILNGTQIRTSGNPYAHVILRGGGGQTNYDEKNLKEVINLLNKKNVQHSSILVDASHENCRNEKGEKDPFLQKQVIENVLKSCAHDPAIEKAFKGFMIESFLHTGCQDIASTEIKSGLSVTDPCLGWEETEKLIKSL